MTYASPTAQTDLPWTTPQMQAAFGAIAPLAPTVTSVMHGEHVKGSAHYDGRAVDVGAFGATPVGFNRPTWDAITTAIASGDFQKIGTIPELVRSPQLQQWAKEHGVELFVDVGSGPHVHFQVGP